MSASLHAVSSPSEVQARSQRLAQTAGYCIAFVALGLVSASLGPTILGLAQRTGSTLSQVGILFTARSLGYLLGSFFGGRLYDRVAGHPIMGTVLLIMGLTMAVVPGVPVLWLMAAIFALTGASEGALDVGGNALLVWVHGAQVGPFMNALHFFFGLGAFFSPILIAQVVQGTGDLIWAYRLLALLMVPAALWLFRVKSPVARAASVEQAQGRNNWGLLTLFFLFFYLYVGAEVSFAGWVATYSVKSELANEASAAYVTSAFWGALTAGRLFAIPVTARLKPRVVLLGDLLGCLLGVGVIMVLPGSAFFLWTGTLILGFSMASIFPTLMSLAERRMHVTGQIAGGFLVISSLGSMSMPWLIGRLFESVGPQVTLLVIGANLLLALGVWALLALVRGPQEVSAPPQV